MDNFIPFYPVVGIGVVFYLMFLSANYRYKEIILKYAIKSLARGSNIYLDSDEKETVIEHYGLYGLFDSYYERHPAWLYNELKKMNIIKKGQIHD
jgi:hypothetical protein